MCFNSSLFALDPFANSLPQIYSFNEANTPDWSPGLQNYVEKLKTVRERRESERERNKKKYECAFDGAFISFFFARALVGGFSIIDRSVWNVHHTTAYTDHARC